jgi:hypothetical protein
MKVIFICKRITSQNSPGSEAWETWYLLMETLPD